MVFEVNRLFEDMAYLTRVRTKKDYEVNMNMFKEKRYALLQPLTEAEDIQAKANQLCEEVSASFKRLGRIRGGDLMNLNYFMIYYIFPAIQLMEEKDRAIRICDTLKDSWNSCFKCDISFADYETLMEGFQNRLFGIPVGKS